MLFLGTKKYPDENDYEEFLSQNGGYSNAYTDMEDTNYYFSVTTEAGPDCQTRPSDALYGALDRFAQFFIEPTFARDSVDREVKAIDSEYKNGITNDSWRSYQLLKSLSDPRHPFSKFGCGNYETLMSLGLDALLNELQAFWETYYKTYNLRLAVVGHSPLDVLQQAVMDTFGQLQYSTGEHRRMNKNNKLQVFPRENAVYGGYNAFSTHGGQLGKIRNIIPLTEKRCIEIYFRTPPLEDPVLRQSKPYSVISHLIGHEAPGSLHDVLNSEGYINGLSSGVAIETADFSLFQISIAVTPRGLANKNNVLDLFFQWMKLITSTDDDTMASYHAEIRQIAEMNFKFRENSDPVDFCSSAAELLFTEELDHKKILNLSSDVTEYDPIVAKSFKERLLPSNSMISIISSDFSIDDKNDNEQWMTEKWYGAKYTEEAIEPEQMTKWANPSNIDSRLHLPEMNRYIPTDFSLRCNDDDVIFPVTEATIQVVHEVDKIAPTRTLLPPTIVNDTRVLRAWHKLDSHWKVPKTYVKTSFLSPATYSSPRSMTLNRIYQRMLNDDLNSFVYDASLAGCGYSVSCTTSGYRFSVKGYSEKIPFLLETLTSRMLSLIHDMKSCASTTSSRSESANALLDKFNKAKDALLRETKNYRLDPPYEIASYNARLLIEERVWYLDNYLDLMEGPEATRHPLTIDECARAAEESLTGRVKCEALCMGNIDTKQCNEVTTILNQRFLNDCKLLSPGETQEFRSMKVPTKNETVAIFGNDVTTRTIPIIYQELAFTETEENNAVEVILQIGSEFELGYEGLALLDLLSHMAHTSAFNQLRTKEQLGYIASAQARRTAGGAWGMSIVVQSSVALPDVLEERCEAWIETFRNELAAMSPEEYAQEASSVIAQLLENETTLSQEVDRVWTEILSTEMLTDTERTPVFDRYLKIAQELYLVDDIQGTNDSSSDVSNRKTPQQLKDRIIEFFDQYIRITSPQRRAMSSRVFSHNAKEQYEQSMHQPGILSSYSDMRYMKQYLGTYSTIPYWFVPNKK
jgi:insulysin